MSLPLKLFLLALVVIVLLLVVPNAMNARDRGKQERTMGDMRTIATALESYSIDAKQYPSMLAVDPAHLAILARQLEPTYAKQVPRADGWGHPLSVVSTPTEYTITSMGKDGVPDSVAPHDVAPHGGTTDFNADIIFSTGSFVQFPDGTRT